MTYYEGGIHLRINNNGYRLSDVRMPVLGTVQRDEDDNTGIKNETFIKSKISNNKRPTRKHRNKRES